MIKLHHLNKSRSRRIIWLLEEIGQPYSVIPYQRDKTTSLAPPELTQIHPLGKSPVIEIDDIVLPESGAITEFLIERYAAEKLAPARDSKSFAEYLYWIHFAESSAILPLLLKLFLDMDGTETRFLQGYAQSEIGKVIGHLERSLEGKDYLVDNRLTGADIMMSFILDFLQRSGAMTKYPNIQRYQSVLEKHASYQAALEIEAKYDAE
ncbi:glutathione S-transferase [Hahella sp. KA22]|uniref:glutathione S-transferase family protein n=1 Tax=Hahella sp. KA22 TaxID=1628392 RepID=UPI000FDEC6E9|nr:glutathione S-transferase [Hahella sp. KA22]AZZ92813.1 glutathione S-transferase [Hahella sp. KA22]QAY56187.1 glutathione S-transferase [Hahella sp. KA22]